MIWIESRILLAYNWKLPNISPLYNHLRARTIIPSPKKYAKQNMSAKKHLLVLKGWSSSLKAHQKELGVVSHPNVSISRVKWVRILQHFYEKNTIVFVSQEVEINSEETFIYALAFPHDIS